MSRSSHSSPEGTHPLYLHAALMSGPPLTPERPVQTVAVVPISPQSSPQPAQHSPRHEPPSKPQHKPTPTQPDRPSPLPQLVRSRTAAPLPNASLRSRQEGAAYNLPYAG